MILKQLERKRKYQEAHPVQYEVGECVTEPDHNRTIRQILEDTVMGRPSMVNLTPLPNAGTATIDKNGKLHDNVPLDKMHDLSVQDDRFLGIMNARERAAQARTKIDAERNKAVQRAQKEVVERAKKEATMRERARAMSEAKRKEE